MESPNGSLGTGPLGRHSGPRPKPGAAGPSCTQLLADLGADVVKVERPGIGDETRAWGPPFLKDADGKDTTESGYYVSANRNKRSVTINLAKPEGAALIRRMLPRFDVLIENFKVGGLQ